MDSSLKIFLDSVPGFLKYKNNKFYNEIFYGHRILKNNLFK